MTTTHETQLQSTLADARWDISRFLDSVDGELRTAADKIGEAKREAAADPRMAAVAEKLEAVHAKLEAIQASIQGDMDAAVEMLDEADDAVADVEADGEEDEDEEDGESE